MLKTGLVPAGSLLEKYSCAASFDELAEIQTVASAIQKQILRESTMPNAAVSKR